MPFSQHTATTKAHPIRSATTSEPQVTGYMDQYDEHWVRVELRGRHGFMRVAALTAGRAAWEELAHQGVVVAASSTRNSIAHQAEAVDYTHQLLVVDRSGWFGAHYVWPGEPVPATVGELPTVDARPSGAVRSRPAGSIAGWRRAVQQLADGQALPTFVLACSFAGLLRHFVGGIADNPAYELCGKDSLGKSTLLLLAASVLGRGGELCSTWSTTVNALEPTMARCADGLLVLDETGHFLSTADPGRARDYRNAVMKLAAGTSKERLGDSAAAARRFVLLSSTNIPVGSLLGELSPDEQAATAVRLTTIAADAGRGYGVFDSLPPRLGSSHEAVQGIAALAEEHGGWAGRAFVECLERRSATPGGRARLDRMIARQLRRFRAAAEPEGVTGGAGRVLDKFALVAAAGELAARWGILPLAGVSDAVLTVYGRRVTSTTPTRAPITARDMVQAYFERHRAGLHDITDGSYPDLNLAELNAAPGFVKRDAGSLWLLIRSARWKAEFLSSGRELLQELHREGRLWPRGDGLQSQDKVRASRPKDRVYRIQVDVPSPCSPKPRRLPAVLSDKGVPARRLKHVGDLASL